MRQFINVAYALMVEGLDADSKRELDDRLETPPGVTPPLRSRGTRDLMAMFGPGGMANRE